MLKKVIFATGWPYCPREIVGEEHLAQTWRTGLPWTQVSGAICLATNKKYLYKALENKNIKSVIISDGNTLSLEEKNSIAKDRAVIVSSQAESFFYTLHLAKLHKICGRKECFVEDYVDPTASIHPTACIARNVSIGRNVIIGPHAVILENTTIKDGVDIGANVVIGENGLFPRIINGEKIHIKHFGGVTVEENCRIQAGCTIAKAVYYGEVTHLGASCHLGFQVSIGHDAVIGNSCSISSKALVAGRCHIGHNCWIGAGALISNTLTIGSNTSIKIGSVVVYSVEAGEEVSGNFAIPHTKNLMRMAKDKR